MTPDEIAERSRELIAKHLGVDRVTDDMLFERDLGVDSLDLVGLTMAAEDEFHIELYDDEIISAIDTVGDAIRMIQQAAKEAKELPK